MGRVEGKVALVSGAGSGIGAACARMLAREGAAAILADIAAEQAMEVARELSGAGHLCFASIWMLPTRQAGLPCWTRRYGDTAG